VSLRRSNKLPETADSAPVYRKPRPDVYTVLLVIALLALLIGIFFLYRHNARYEFKSQGAPAVTSLRIFGPSNLDASRGPHGTLA